jgi:alanine racemase
VDTRDQNQWIELDAAAYGSNLALFRALAGERRDLCVVVKANAYGHGVREIARLARRGGATSFAVHSLEEAVELREAGAAEPILLLGYTPRGRLDDVVALGLRVVVYDLDTLRELDRLGRERGVRVPVHLEVETGTHRQGIDGARLLQLADELRSAAGCRAEAVYTHFANIEDTTRHTYARRQIDAFGAIVADLARVGLADVKVHSACSAAALLFPETRGDMLRVGISQYGLWSSKQTYLSYRLAHPDDSDEILRPVLSWRCRISQLKDVPADSYVGYGCTYLTTRPTRLAVLPIGYSDGFDRGLSNVGWVLVNGRRAPVRGRVCMNLVMVDVTDIPDVRVEDVATLIGRQGEAEITVDEIADLAGTINYEVVARLRAGIPRIVVGDAAPTAAP